MKITDIECSRCSRIRRGRDLARDHGGGLWRSGGGDTLAIGVLVLHVSFLIHDFLATRSTTATAVAAEALVAVTGQREIASRRLAGT